MAQKNNYFQVSPTSMARQEDALSKQLPGKRLKIIGEPTGDKVKVQIASRSELGTVNVPLKLLVPW